MERYYKDIEGTRVWYAGVIKTAEKQIFTWDEALILADGWTKYVPEPYNPTLAELKEQKCAEIDSYDSSPAVNEFFIGNASLWLDKATRVGLALRFDAEAGAGKTATTLWYGTVCYQLPLATAKQILSALEVYASEAYDSTASHKAAVMALTSKKAVKEYDYTTGYPEKLSFEL